MSDKFKYRVLVVDDDEMLLETTAELLAREGYEVAIAKDGFEALALLRGSQPDLVISDLKMPNMSGFELLGVVRKRFPAIAVVARSGEFIPAIQDRVLADAFIGKGPNSEFELVETVRELLSQSPLRAQPSRQDLTPVWVPRSASGYVVLTCPMCLRSFSVSATHLQLGTVRKEPCFYCEAEISYRVDETVGAALHRDKNEETRTRIEATKKTIETSRQAIAHSKTLFNRE